LHPFTMMAMNMGQALDPEITLLLKNLDKAYDQKGWHGPNLRGSLRRLAADQASWRPAPKRHSIADIVVHCAYWKYAVRRRLRGDKRGSFPIKGSNWFRLPTNLSEQEWKSYVRLLDAEHTALRQAIADLPPRLLHQKTPGSKVRNSTLIYGIAAHDLYHTGQVRLLKSLQSKRPSP
jgi:uncharacterized damage-inducible protein DinB